MSCPSSPSPNSTNMKFYMQNHAKPPHPKNKTPSTLLTLPRKLQDHIFSLAYPQTSNLSLIHLSAWYDRQLPHNVPFLSPGTTTTTKTITDTLDPFPSPFINNLLISKSFFLSAARAWISTQIFDIRHHTTSHLPISASGIILTFAKIFRLRAEQLERLKDFPQIEALRIDIDAHVLMAPQVQGGRGGGKVPPWKKRFHGDDFERLTLFVELLCFGGQKLRSVRLYPLPCPEARGNAEQEYLWRENVRAFEAAIETNLRREGIWRRRVLDMCREGRARRVRFAFSGDASRRAEEKGQPLYIGSRVCFGTSVLRNEDEESGRRDGASVGSRHDSVSIVTATSVEVENTGCKGVEPEQELEERSCETGANEREEACGEGDEKVLEQQSDEEKTDPSQNSVLMACTRNSDHHGKVDLPPEELNIGSIEKNPEGSLLACGIEDDAPGYSEPARAAPPQPSDVILDMLITPPPARPGLCGQRPSSSRGTAFLKLDIAYQGAKFNNRQLQMAPQYAADRAMARRDEDAVGSNENKVSDADGAKSSKQRLRRKAQSPERLNLQPMVVVEQTRSSRKAKRESYFDADMIGSGSMLAVLSLLWFVTQGS